MSSRIKSTISQKQKHSSNPPAIFLEPHQLKSPAVINPLRVSSRISTEVLMGIPQGFSLAIPRIFGIFFRNSIWISRSLLGFSSRVPLGISPGVGLAIPLLNQLGIPPIVPLEIPPRVGLGIAS